MKSISFAILFAAFICLCLAGCASGAEAQKWQDMYTKCKSDYDALAKSSADKIDSLTRLAAKNQEVADVYQKGYEKMQEISDKFRSGLEEEFRRYYGARETSLKEDIAKMEEVKKDLIGQITKLMDERAELHAKCDALEEEIEGWKNAK